MKFQRMLLCTAGVWVAALGITAPAVGQTLGAVEQRLSKLEGSMRSVEQKLGKRGANSVPAAVSSPAAGSSAGSMASVAEELSRRLDALERQLALIVSQGEESGFASRRLGEDHARFKSDVELRLGSVEEQLEKQSATLKTVQSRRAVEATANSNPVSPPPSDPIAAEFATARGYADAGEWNKAEFAFSAFLATHGTHPKAAEARYWQGRSFVAQDRAGDAAKAFLDVFQTWPKDPVVLDSLLGLGGALLRMKPANPVQACAVFDQIEELFGASVSPAQVATLRDGRIQADCSTKSS